MSNRRIFLKNLTHIAAASAIGVSLNARAQAAQVANTDPQAAALGYKSDTTKVDKTKYPNHAPTQKCMNCQLFQGKAAEATGPCPLFAGKVVAANGWCSA